MKKSFLSKSQTQLATYEIDYITLSDCLRGLKAQEKLERFPDRKEKLRKIRKDIAFIIKIQFDRKAA